MFHSTASSGVTKGTPSFCQELEWKFYACIEHVLLRQKLPIQTNLFHVSFFVAWGGKERKVCTPATPRLTGYFRTLESWNGYRYFDETFLLYSRLS